MRFKRAKGVRVFEAWTNEGPVRLDGDAPVLTTDDPAVIALLEASPHVVVDQGEKPKKAKAPAGKGASA